MKYNKRRFLLTGVMLLVLLLPATALAEEQQVEERYVPDAPHGLSGTTVQPLYLQQLSGLLEKRQALEDVQTLQHEVARGETLGAIASKYDVSLDYLMQVNNLNSANFLREGQVLTLLSEDPYQVEVSGSSHTLRRGETIWELSRQYDVSIDDILAFNNISDPHRLQAGQAVRIPGKDDEVPQAPPERDRLVASRSGSSQSTVARSSGFIWPVQGRISSGYGPRWGSFHNGIDIAAPTGTPIKAIASGTVVTAGWRQGYGYMVRIDHHNGWQSLYGHASRLFVSEGQSVDSGHQIAAVGATGNATGPHLHLEMIYQDEHRNPIQHLPAR
ncbi:peptidoglycan DD-metalloendopeptidase family protein [Dethiobacter alkaliphilus]|uniref:peptidoglycan DD-metalloendopeptidase family protein n=1 Tax=Dethiobacter alkaliphilus TaxID=427926 RepID=UPI0022280C34|nr:M23 family metallopeptidase [Dethiobacter alkaliphilus]MCW3488890.1 M23 family metallopeptidase [Dethiobacter alkaliphilus]